MMLILIRNILLAAVSGVLLAGCFASVPSYNFPTQSEIRVPVPIEGNTGKYMAPYTSDDVVAEWATKAISVEAGSKAGEAVGAYAGAKALEQIPFFGSWLGRAAGEKAGRALALSNIGGEEFIKETSDLSFNSTDELAVWMYAKHGLHESYQDVLKAVQTIYPDLKEGYFRALSDAPRLTPAEIAAKTSTARNATQAITNDAAPTGTTAK